MRAHEGHPAVRGGHVNVDCYVRTDSISDPVEEHLASLERLADRGVVDGLNVYAWPSEVVLSEYTEHLDVVRAFRTFQEWATRWAVHLDPAFRLADRSSEFTGEAREILHTPALCLAVAVDGRLREVFPHRSDGRTYTVDDAIETLERRAEVGDDAPDRGAGGECPRCGGELETGQGLYACGGCGWSGIAAGAGAFYRYDASDDPTGDAPVVESSEETRNKITR